MCHVFYMLRPYHRHCFDHTPFNSARAFSDIFLGNFFMKDPLTVSLIGIVTRLQDGCSIVWLPVGERDILFS